MAVAEQNVNHESEDHQGKAIGAGRRELAETLLEAGQEIESRKEGLKQNQTGEGSQLLVFETELGESAGFTFDLSSAKLHGGGLQGLVIVSSARSIITPKGRHLSFYFQISDRSTSPAVRLKRGVQGGAKGRITKLSPYLTVFAMQLEGR
jgi:hypothetical protein